MQTCSKGKDKNTGAVVWRTTCSRCHKDKDGGTSGARGQYSRTGQCEQEPNDGDRLLVALAHFLHDTETLRRIGAAALDALSATHEHLAEGTDVYRTWRQRVGSEIMRGAVQLAGFDSTNLPRELLPICERMIEIILEHLPSLCSRLAPQSVGDVLAHKDVPARRKRGRPAKQAKDPKKRDGGESLKYSTFQQQWKASYPWLRLVPVVAVCSTDGRDECPGCTNCCVMSCSVCLRNIPFRLSVQPHFTTVGVR